MARISVLVPVYNVEAYVAEALASIQSQTFTDIEMVVVDDGSTDGTLRIVKQIASTDSRIRIVRTPRNLGPQPRSHILPGSLHCPYGWGRYCFANQA